MGPFQLMSQGPVFNNKTAWNKAAPCVEIKAFRRFSLLLIAKSASR